MNNRNNTGGAGANQDGQNNAQNENNQQANNENQEEDDLDNESYEDELDESSLVEEEKTGSDAKLGCKHYKRRCSKRCPQCLEFFPCRLCHDDKKYNEELDPKKNHKIDRHAVTQIRCNECETI